MAETAVHSAGTAEATRVDDPEVTGPEDYRRASPGHRLAAFASFRNISAIYLFAFMFVVFALWIPDTFLTAGT